jgi:hypothetical protein
MEIPEIFIIKFREGEHAKLKYINQNNNVAFYESSYMEINSDKAGDKIKLIVRVEYTPADEEENIQNNK